MDLDVYGPPPFSARRVTTTAPLSDGARFRRQNDQLAWRTAEMRALNAFEGQKKNTPYA
jgi:hypothetical protein